MGDVSTPRRPRRRWSAPTPPGDVMDKNLSTLADEILELEAETFEISDYSDASEVVLAGCTSTSSTSTSSSTCSTTSCSA